MLVQHWWLDSAHSYDMSWISYKVTIVLGSWQSSDTYCNVSTQEPHFCALALAPQKSCCSTAVQLLELLFVAFIQMT